ncbi:hypothetical protein V6N11_073810 [Hibiscus sabdariffa]|uniref:Uncharacterized protein n=1 Tax=Hibiscus sabdariffa TaxID=183260 RepID=A0ABR2P4R9_9ROSI
MIPRSLSATGYVRSCCSVSTTHGEAKSNAVKQQQSAPVNIPDWSKVSANTRNGSWHHDDDDEYNATKFPPPHEIIAKRLAGSQISSFSVFPGIKFINELRANLMEQSHKPETSV